jgi:hypothetical protein
MFAVCATAHADISFHFIHQQLPGITPAGYEVVAGFSAVKDNGVHKTQQFAITPGKDSWGYTSNTLFAPDPAGNYHLQAYCTAFKFGDYKRYGGAQSKRYDTLTIPDNSLVTVEISCRPIVDDNGMAMAPVVLHISVVPQK